MLFMYLHRTLFIKQSRPIKIMSFYFLIKRETEKWSRLIANQLTFISYNFLKTQMMYTSNLNSFICMIYYDCMWLQWSALYIIIMCNIKKSYTNQCLIYSNSPEQFILTMNLISYYTIFLKRFYITNHTNYVFSKYYIDQ